jgi:hypothetical protein
MGGRKLRDKFDDAHVPHQKWIDPSLAHRSVFSRLADDQHFSGR